MQPKASAMGTSEHYSYFILYKEQPVLTLLEELISAVFDEVLQEEINSMVQKDWTPKSKKAELKDINAIVDTRHHFEEEGIALDIIFGAHKVFLTTHTNKEKGEKLRAFMQEHVSLQAP